MKLGVVSDLHIDFDGGKGLCLPGGNVLLVAGDMCEAKRLTEQSAVAVEMRDSIAREFAKYKEVLYIMGNHEHYNASFHRTPVRLREMLLKIAPNATLLDNEAVRLNNGVWVYGATMWTSCGGGDDMHRDAIQSYMADFEVIDYENRRYTPKDSMREFYLTQRKLQQFLDDHKNEDVVVMTHHAPSFESVPDAFRHPRYVFANTAYATELSEFIRINPNIVKWVHGHMHQHRNYEVYGTQIVCNPRGYVNLGRKGGAAEKSGFMADFTINVEGEAIQ